ncbi:MAG: universal stress protein, partial [Candidatus Subteraquimicrobiales bacterium]|nr:universal stress protein [Candidatus Subteraquimicrobiales bacterium]
MFRKILFPTDLSTASQRVLDCIPDLKSVGLEEVIITHVIDVRLAGGAAVFLKEYDREILDRKRAELEKEGLKVKVEVLIGIPFVEIVELAKRENVSMIVMAAKGESFVEQALLGSVAENVIRHAGRPVLIHKFVPLVEKS